MPFSVTAGTTGCGGSTSREWAVHGGGVRATIVSVSDRGPQRAIDELLDRAVAAINRGDRSAANDLADQVLAVDRANADAEELLSAPAEHGELRRLTIMFADLVDSTALSTRVEPEVYRTVVGRYREEVLRAVNHYGGHVGNTKGDGLLAVFGHPDAHEDDVRRAAQAGLDITRSIAALSVRVRQRFGFGIDVRVRVHRGLVYLDTAQDDVYGLAANLAARMCSVAEPGTVAVSDAVARLIGEVFELTAGAPQPVKGIDTEVVPYQVVAERDTATQRTSGPMVGRADERALINSAWDRARSGTLHPPGIAIRGEPGIGKSRLARSMIEVARTAEAPVLELVGSPFHTDVGLYPVRRLLERRCGIRRTTDSGERLDRLRAEIAAVGLDADAIALLAPVLGVTAEYGYTPAPAEGARLAAHITAAVNAYLTACTGAGPALLVVEDMHWFDSSTSEVVSGLLTAGPGSVLTVMTARDLASLPGEPLATPIELTPLGPEDIERLVTALHPDSSPALRRAVRRRCDGIPLYIEEVVAKLKAQPDDAGGDDQVPDSLYEALFARLRSSEQALRFVEAAATVGNHFDRSVVATVTGLPDNEIDSVISELEDGLVLQPVTDDVWRFRHELLREVAAELPPPSIRRRLHEQVAEALASESGRTEPDWPEIARHFQRADRPDDAISAHEKASAVARRRGALSEARMHLIAALEQLEQLPAGAGRDHREVNLLLHHGFLTATAEGSGSDSAAADFERCLQLSGTDPHADELFSTLMALFTYYVNRADLHRADEVVRTLRVGVDGGRDWWRAENLAGAGIVCWLRGEFESASGYLEDAAVLATDRGDRDFAAEWFAPFDPLVLDLTSLAQARWALGDLAGADAALVSAVQRADQLEFPQGPFSRCYARYVESTIAAESGQLERCLATSGEINVLAGRHGLDQWIAVGALMFNVGQGLTALRADPVAVEALAGPIAVLTGWVTVCRQLESKGFLTAFDGLLARLLLANGSPTEARRRIDAGLALARETGMHYYDAELLRLRAQTHSDPGYRHEDLYAAGKFAQHKGANGFALRAAIDDYELRGPAALDGLRTALARMPAAGSWPEVDRAREILDRDTDQSTR